MEDKEIKIFPFVLEQISDEREWGSEIWKLADLGFKDSIVHRGLLEGNTLGEVMETYLDRIVGDRIYYRYGRQFPVQVKVLKVKSRTPLTVCPDDQIAAQRYDSLGKKKLWYIADAEGDAKVYLGFRRDVTATEFYEACLDASIDEYLNEVPVKKGDCFLINPGTVHCAGEGVVIVEISESSDLDLKICNWGKTADSQDDPIFLEEAFDFVTMDMELPILTDGVKLAEAEEFVVTMVNLTKPVRVQNGNPGEFSAYYCVSGSAIIQTPAVGEDGKNYMESLAISEGDTALVPADCPEFYLVPNATSAALIELLGGRFEEEPAPELAEDDEEDHGKHDKLWS